MSRKRMNEKREQDQWRKREAARLEKLEKRQARRELNREAQQWAATVIEQNKARGLQI